MQRTHCVCHCGGFFRPNARVRACGPGPPAIESKKAQRIQEQQERQELDLEEERERARSTRAAKLATLEKARHEKREKAAAKAAAKAAGSTRPSSGGSSPVQASDDLEDTDDSSSCGSSLLASPRGLLGLRASPPTIAAPPDPMKSPLPKLTLGPSFFREHPGPSPNRPRSSPADGVRPINLKWASDPNWAASPSSILSRGSTPPSTQPPSPSAGGLPAAVWKSTSPGKQKVVPTSPSMASTPRARMPFHPPAPPRVLELSTFEIVALVHVPTLLVAVKEAALESKCVCERVYRSLLGEGPEAVRPCLELSVLREAGSSKYHGDLDVSDEDKLMTAEASITWLLRHKDCAEHDDAWAEQLLSVPVPLSAFGLECSASSYELAVSSLEKLVLERGEAAFLPGLRRKHDRTRTRVVLATDKAPMSVASFEAELRDTPKELQEALWPPVATIHVLLSSCASPDLVAGWVRSEIVESMRENAMRAEGFWPDLAAAR